MHPTNFGAPVDDALIAEINKKYANRVLHDVGLCICVFDLSEAGEGKVRYGDGFLWYKGAYSVLYLSWPDARFQWYSASSCSVRSPQRSFWRK